MALTLQVVREQLNSWWEQTIIGALSNSMTVDIEDSAEETIVLALKVRPGSLEAQDRESPRSAPVRLPQPQKKPVSVDTALDEVLERYPKTLEYLAR